MSGNSNEIQGRYFIVGSARSGTTLLQAMLANHPQVFSFPETHFFCQSAPRGRVRRRLGIVRKPIVDRSLQYLFGLLGRNDAERRIPRRSPFFRTYGKVFVRTVDSASMEAGRHIWVEKTPHHIDFIPLIQRTVKQSKFIHILRDGRDVVASQYHAQQQDRSYWKKWPIGQLAHQWNVDIQRSLSYQGDFHHYLLSYDDLVANPDAVLHELTNFMGIEFDTAVLRHWEATDRILGARRSEPWMQTAFKPLENRKGKKFASVFTIEQQQFVESQLLWGGDVSRLFSGRQAPSERSTPRVGATA